ncbi:hypothetical protein L2725_15350 [Shewanella corallii]|uniref:Uncharacterized protein n=1 Tax=Shewanella corallii TaxID=560080 RepID=A0ABT0N9T9_9GAMM|nr:hypothetical protein [Shewanella corallii]MCL2915135.1 hypothetical protein [Shewanella corallii]
MKLYLTPLLFATFVLPLQAKPVAPSNTIKDSDGNPILWGDKPEGAFDADGNPIQIRSDGASIINISPQKQTAKPINTGLSPSNRKYVSVGKPAVSRRPFVANDPSCRWLDQRMTQLESAPFQKYGHHQRELQTREWEWRCLKCYSDGPGRSDLDRCRGK